MRYLGRAGWFLVLLSWCSLVWIVPASAGDRIYYYHNDHLGTPQVMTDETGNVVWRADYKPFGEATVTTSEIENGFRFPGQYRDEETGLHQNYHRSFGAQTGRYLEADPLGLIPDVNLYLYVQDNPVNAIDPFGLITLPELYAKVEAPAKPYVVGGALVVTGGVTTFAGSVLTIVGYGSIPETGPAGALTGTTGLGVAFTGATMFTLGLDVYADELRNKLGLSPQFDVWKDFELLPNHESNKSNRGPCK